jgi:hypothetical protein
LGGSCIENSLGFLGFTGITMGVSYGLFAPLAIVGGIIPTIAVGYLLYKNGTKDIKIQANHECTQITFCNTASASPQFVSEVLGGMFWSSTFPANEQK